MLYVIISIQNQFYQTDDEVRSGDTTALCRAPLENTVIPGASQSRPVLLLGKNSVGISLTGVLSSDQPSWHN